MTSTLDSRTPPLGSTPGQPQPVQPSSPRRTRTAVHYVAIVIGCLLLMPGLGMMAGGGAMLVGQAVATDDDGYFRFTLDRLESDGVAIATTDLWLDDVEGDASPWLFDWLDVDLRLRVDGAALTDEVFVGIARSEDVERYLADVMYSEVIEVEGSTTRYDDIAGRRSVDPPVDQDFWAASASGVDEQELQWEARGGRWSVVVMNSDGSAVVSADVEVGAKSGAVTPVAIVLLIIGGILVAVAITVIVIGARGRRADERPHPEDSPLDGPVTGAPLPPPTPASAVPHPEN